jgi:hypothetical protein
MRKTVSTILVLVFILSALSPALVTSGAAQGPTVEWRIKLPARSGLGEPTAPTVADIDGDGLGEIVLTSGDSLYVIRARGTTKWKYSITGNFTGATVADIDANTEKEIIAVTDTGTVHAFSRDGSHLWSYETKNSIHFAPMISDMNNDGRLDIVVVTASGGIFIIDNHGSMFSIKNAGASVEVPSSMAPMYMAIDHQVLSFIYVATVERQLDAIDYMGALSGYYRILPGLPTGGLAVGNIDNDTLPDVVVPTAGKVTVSYGDDPHHKQWNGTFATNSPVLAPVLADINQDGKLEIIAGNSDGDIQQFSSSGTDGWMTHVEGGLAGLCAIKAPDVLFLAMTKNGHLVQIDATGHSRRHRR